MLPQNNAFLNNEFSDSELILGLVGTVGTKLDKVSNVLHERLKIYNYTNTNIRISKDVIPEIINIPQNKFQTEYERIDTMMDAGNQARSHSEENSVLALGVTSIISASRPKNGQNNLCRHAFIINSLKHPDEVKKLRDTYPESFYLISVYSDEGRRMKYLVEDLRMNEEKAKKLIKRDEDENLDYGQKTADTFHLSDFFILLDENEDRLKYSIWRILDILFGHPFITPVFDEYAMFMAFSASLRSADLSRQVGAVIAKDEEIIATGANDCPKFGGGLYWTQYKLETGEYTDVKKGRDYMRGEESNDIEQQKIIDDILDNIVSFNNTITREEINKILHASRIKDITHDIEQQKIIDDILDNIISFNNTSACEKINKILHTSQIKDITEYGRVIHAEMDAILACARNSISLKGATLYCTTFPCHNCAKHIIAAGIKRVVYVEPYSKSKAAELHNDSICLGFPKKNIVNFEPFVGVGPRRFFDLFSMKMGSGYPKKRKDENGKKINWSQDIGKLRIQMLPCSYIEKEILACKLFRECKN